jgi:catechol-2,3-dioxygenase
MVSPVKLAHIALKTRDIKASSDWYRNVLDADVVFENEMLCFLTYDDEHHRVVLAQDDGYEPGGPSAGLHHVSFTYEKLDDLFDTFERLQALDIRPHWCINHGPTLSMYYLDPMGNQVELQIDSMPLEDAVDFVKSDTFRANPIGIEFNPEELNERRKAGESAESLMAYTP